MTQEQETVETPRPDGAAVEGDSPVIAAVARYLHEYRSKSLEGVDLQRWAHGIDRALSGVIDAHPNAQSLDRVTREHPIAQQMPSRERLREKIVIDELREAETRATTAEARIAELEKENERKTTALEAIRSMPTDPQKWAQMATNMRLIARAALTPDASEIEKNDDN